ncbi:MAG: hypothetical protein F6K16_05840 [Symploca sp. SIO2B6]|nr:hypothetical protein [Symploca sp. SIO2B6]
MPVEAKDGLRFILTPSDDLIDPFVSQVEWPRLSCSQANQLALEFGDLRVDGKVGIGTNAPTEKLEVAGKVKTTDLDVSGVIATNQLNVTGSVNSPLNIDSNLTVNGVITTNQLSITGSVTTPLKLDDILNISGNVGIGTATTPTEKLEVAGKVKAIDLDISGAITTNQLSVIGSVTTPLTIESNLTVNGAITTNQVNVTGTATAGKFIGDGSELTGINTSKWSEGSSNQIYYNSGNVGIGITNPLDKLDINGDLRLRGSDIKDTGGTSRISLYDNGNLYFREDGGSVTLAITKDGTVGIGTTNPTSGSKLDLRGNLYVGGKAAIASNNYWHRAQSTVDNRYGYFEVRRKTSNRRGCYFGYGSPGKYIDLRLEDGNSLAITGGNVGMGTKNPRTPLHLYSRNDPTILRIQSSDAFGAGRIEFWSDPQGATNEWRPGFIQSTDRGGFTGGLAFFVNGSGFSRKTSAVEVMRIENGSVNIKGRLFVTNIPYGDRRNMQWDSSSKLLYHDNSSRKTKENIQSLEDDFSKVLQVEPKTYTRPGNSEHWEIGYIAEEFDDLGLNKLVYYDEDGSPGAINYRKISMYLVEIVKDLNCKIEEYEDRIKQLEQQMS